MQKIKCPNCPKGILCSYEEDKISDGIIEGRCNWCRCMAQYDTKTKKYKILSTKSNVAKTK